jgi:hypothetical protein
MFLPRRQGRNKVLVVLGRARNGRGVGEFAVTILSKICKSFSKFSQNYKKKLSVAIVK